MTGRNAFLILLGVVFLSACGSNSRALSPANATWENNWAAEPDDAVVFIGIAGDSTIYSVDVSGTRYYSYEGLQKREDLDVIAIPVKVGEEFELTRATTYYNDNGYTITERFHDFDDLPTISIDRPGAYVHGILFIERRQAGFTQERQELLITAALLDHPRVFEQMEGANF